MLLLQDLWQLISAVFLNWVALISGVVSIAILIFQYKHDGRLPRKERFFSILWIFILPATFWAWHGLQDELRSKTKQLDDLKE